MTELFYVVRCVSKGETYYGPFASADLASDWDDGNHYDCLIDHFIESVEKVEVTNE